MKEYFEKTNVQVKAKIGSNKKETYSFNIHKYDGIVETRAKAIILMRQLIGLKKVIDQVVRRKDE